MGYSAGDAYVQLVPAARGWNRMVPPMLAQQLSGVGEKAGRDLGANVGRGVGSAMASVGKLTGSVGANVGRMVGTVGAGLGGMADSAERVMSRVGGSVRRGLVAPLTGARELLSSYGLTARDVLMVAGGFAVSAGLRFVAFGEQAETAFKTMLGSAERAKQFMQELTTFAARTPFELPQVTAAAQRLMAFGFAAQDVIPTLTAIGDAVAGLGGSAEQVNQVTNAIGQMMAKGKIQSDEMLQLTEAGIPALRILANQYGVTTAKMQEMITEGLVPSSEAIPRLLQGIEDGTTGAAGATTRFAGMMSEQSKTLRGQWSTFVDNFNAAMGRLIQPALPAIKSGLSGLTNVLGALPGIFSGIANHPVFQAIMGAVRAAIGALVDGFRALFAAFRDGGDAITASGLAGFLQAVGIAARNVWDDLQPVLSFFWQIAKLLGGVVVVVWRKVGDIISNYVSPALVTVSGWLRPLTPLIVAVAAGFATWFAVGAAVSVVRGALSLLFGTVTLVTRGIALLRLGVFALQLAFAVNPVGVILAALAALVAGIIFAWNHFQGFRNVVVAVWNAIKTAASVAWSALGTFFGWIGTGIGKVASAFHSAYLTVKTAWDLMGGIVRAVWEHTIRVAFDALKAAVGAVGDAFSATVSAIKTVWNTIKAICVSPINFVIDVIWNKGIRKAWNAIVGWIPGLDLTLGELKTIKVAQGGVIPGYAPGIDTVPALLSPGEGVLVPEAVRMIGPETVLALNALARRGRGGTGTGPAIGPDGMPRFFLGGLWDGITNVAKGIGHVASKVAGAIADAATFIAHFTSDPLGTLASMVPGLDGLRKWGSKGWGKAITKLPGSIFGGLISAIKGALGLEDDGQGGPASGGIAKLQAFANQQRGKTYLWGATGPGHWDCSGLVGALWALSHGKEPYRRYMTTHTMGVGRHGMKAGKGVFTVYLGDGHTAADLGGLHAEAYNGNGTPLAIGRVGTPLSYYHTTMHVFGRGGLVGLKHNARRRWESWWETGWPEPPARYDAGGLLPPGLSTVYNDTGRPEAVLTAAQWEAVQGAAGSDGGAFTGVLTLDSGELLGVVRGEIHRANEATGRAIARRTR